MGRRICQSNWIQFSLRVVWPVIYVSIDPSSDGTERYIKERAESDDRIFVLPIGQRFGGAAKNFRLICDVDVGDFDYVCSRIKTIFGFRTSFHAPMTFCRLMKPPVIRVMS